MLTSDIMRRMWPHGDAKIPGLLDGIAAAAPTVLRKYGLTSNRLIAHAMAQFSHECGAGEDIVENLNYSAEGLMSIWPNRFDAAKAAAFAHDQRKIANEVYNGRMGNRLNSDDGWNYRGRGGGQVTGRDGYTRLGRKVGLDLLNEPELVNHPRHFLECAVADFIICGCLPFAVEDDVSGVTYHLNGGYIGLAERTAWLARWKAALHLSGKDAAIHSSAWVQQSLNKLGTEPPLAVDGSFGPVTVAAVKAFQLERHLTPDGKLGPRTVAAIEGALAAAAGSAAAHPA
jgi:putative chitinase